MKNEAENLDRSTAETFERIRLLARSSRRAAVQKKETGADDVQTEILQTGENSTARIDRGCPND